MAVYLLQDAKAAAHLFAGWEEGLVLSALQGCMGEVWADAPQNPRSARLLNGGFCCFAGAVDRALLEGPQGRAGRFTLLVPQTPAWAAAIEDAFGGAAKRHMRYATKKDTRFDEPALRAFAAGLDSAYAARLIDAALYEQALSLDWAADLCANYPAYKDYEKNGLGVAILKGGELVAGASSYVHFRGGIEIQIDTRRDHRRRGLASVCGAMLILECLRRGLYPSWDAHDRVSLALAEKLGYEFDREYPSYETTAF